MSCVWYAKVIFRWPVGPELIGLSTKTKYPHVLNLTNRHFSWKSYLLLVLKVAILLSQAVFPDVFTHLYLLSRLVSQYLCSCFRESSEYTTATGSTLFRRPQSRLVLKYSQTWVSSKLTADFCVSS